MQLTSANLFPFLLQVEPQEKKKTPKGRAKKRITYTRRFVNVTMTGGKRKVSWPDAFLLRFGFESTSGAGLAQGGPRWPWKSKKT